MNQRFRLSVLFAGIILIVAGCGSQPGGAQPPGSQSLEISITGLPEGLDANVFVVGPDQTIHLTASTTLSDLPTGNYDILPHGVADYGVTDGGTVTLQAGRSSHFEVGYEQVATVLAPETVVLDGAAGAALASEDDGVITFSSSTPELDALEVGDVILTGITPGTPGGFVGRVTSVSGLTVGTEPVDLDEAIEYGAFSVSHQFTPDDIDDEQGVISLVPGTTATIVDPLTVLPAEYSVTRRPICISMNAEVGSSGGGGSLALAVNGSLCVDMQADLTLEFFAKVIPTKIDLLVSGDIVTDLSVTGLAAVGVDVAFPIAIFPLAAIPVGPTGITFVPTLKIMVGASGNVSAELTTGVTYTVDYAVGLRAEGFDWQPTARASHDLSFQWPTTTTAVTARVFAGPELSTTINNIAGPTFGLNAYLQVRVTPFDAPFWTLDMGLEFTAGVEAFSGLLRFSRTIYDHSWELARGTDEPPQGTRMWLNTAAASGMPPAVARNDLVFVAGLDNNIYGLGANLRELWRLPAGAFLWQPVLMPSGDLAVSSGNGLWVLAPGGAQRWRALSGQGLSGPAGIGSDGTIVVEDEFGILHAFSSAGNLKWTYETGSRDWRVQPLVHSDGTVYHGTGDGGIVALDASGELIWSRDFGIYLHSTVLVRDETLYASIAHEGRSILHALDRRTGEEIWSTEIGRGDNVGPITAGTDGNLYMIVGNSELTAITPAGSVAWRHRPGGWLAGTPAVNSRGHIFISTENKVLHALTPAGQSAWTRTLTGVADSGVVMGENDVVFVSSSTDDGGIEAVNTVER